MAVTSASTRSFTRTQLTWLVYFMLAYYSFMINGLGPVMPFLRTELRLSFTLSSLHYSAFALGMVLAGLFGDRVVRRLGRRRGLWGGGFGLVAGTVLLTAGSHPLVTVAGTLMMGTLGSLTFFLVNATLADYYADQRIIALTEANVIGGLAAAGAPLVIGQMQRAELGWRFGLLVVGALFGLAYFWLRRVPILEPRPASQAETTAGAGLKLGFWLNWLLLYLVVSIEFCVLYWGADYLMAGFGLPKTEAVTSLSLFLGAMLVGRFGGSRLAYRVRESWLLLAGLILVLVGFPLYAFSPYAGLSLAALALTGLGVANLYPVSLSLSIQAAAGKEDLASARAAMGSGLAILTMPLLLGWLADQTSLATAYIGLIAVLIGAAWLVYFVNRVVVISS
ncbi:MAG TPA: MFS transporter [Anaerolineae bacterium]|mgnify:CR=1 FL=1|nr:MFS transporter [Anaerolineae bacterium]